MDSSKSPCSYLNAVSLSVIANTSRTKTYQLHNHHQTTEWCFGPLQIARVYLVMNGEAHLPDRVRPHRSTELAAHRKRRCWSDRARNTAMNDGLATMWIWRRVNKRKRIIGRGNPYGCGSTTRADWRDVQDGDDDLIHGRIHPSVEL